MKFSFFKHTKMWEGFQKFTSNQNIEIMGTFHLKIFIFDNSVLLSGANLQEDYFVNRKDRYFFINDAKEFADYLQDLLDIFVDLGEKIDPDKNHLVSDANSDDSMRKIFKNRMDLFNYTHGISDERI